MGEKAYKDPAINTTISSSFCLSDVCSDQNSRIGRIKVAKSLKMLNAALA